VPVIRRLCERLNAAARDAGATILLRGTSGVEVQSGTPPTIAFDHGGRRQELRPKLVIGADGRGSVVARQIGLQAEVDPLHHFMSGLLFEGADGWPEDCPSVGVEGDKTFFIFPGEWPDRALSLLSFVARAALRGSRCDSRIPETMPWLPERGHVEAGGPDR
jgi:2-polyprenyl-6-methoxyphenol hydroxylase-like FAD-dependent oxidoreductase